MHQAVCSCCNLWGWGEWYYSDHGDYWFFLCYGDCQDEDRRIDLMLAICFDWVK